MLIPNRYEVNLEDAGAVGHGPLSHRTGSVKAKHIMRGPLMQDTSAGSTAPLSARLAEEVGVSVISPRGNQASKIATIEN
jgi:hypothetical protein